MSNPVPVEITPKREFPPTFDQAYQLLSLAREAGVSRAKLQVLYAKGLISDVLRCEEPEKVERETVRLALGYDPSVFRVRMGGPENTDEIVRMLGFTANTYIRQAYFPLKPAKVSWEDEIEILPDAPATELEALQVLKNNHLKRPTYEHALRFAQQHGKSVVLRKKRYVVFPHGLWSSDRRTYNCAICLDCKSEHHAGGRILYLLNLGDDGIGSSFDNLYAWAGVRSRPQPSTGGTVV